MKKITLLISFLFVIITINAQSIVGQWQTIDDETNEVKSIIEIFKQGEQYFGKITKIIDQTKKGRKCELCPDTRKGQPLLGMEIIRDLVQNDDKYEEGTILDPKEGKIYDCKIWLEDKNTLNVRGYIAFFYRTQTWLRVIN